uniref:Uncharacterized protein n=1 Tax=Tetranychus urticae TaxID=32264 RepID=T1JQY7_TETUR
MAFKWIKMLKTILISLIVISLGSSMVQAAKARKPRTTTTLSPEAIEELEKLAGLGSL